MKRIYLAVLFILIAAVTAAAETGYVSAKTDYYIYSIEAVDKLMMKNDFEQAINLCSKIENNWNNSVKKFDILLIHDYVDKIGNGISRMKAFAENASMDMYFSESVTTKKELASIKESEYPSIENIL